MISREMEIKIPSGLDPSTIALFIQIASQYDSSVYVEVKNKKVNAKSIMGMMTLGVPAGGKINASFLRCNNISLAYNLSGKKIAGFARNIAMSLNVTNPFIIVSKDFKGKDPEVATGSQPIFRNYTLSLNISF